MLADARSMLYSPGKRPSRVYQAVMTPAWLQRTSFLDARGGKQNAAAPGRGLCTQSAKRRAGVEPVGQHHNQQPANTGTCLAVKPLACLTAAHLHRRAI